MSSRGWFAEADQAVGTVNKHFSYQTEFAYEDGEVMLETLEGQLIAGGAERNVIARFGLLVPELWTKCNTQRLTVFTPLVVIAIRAVPATGVSVVARVRAGMCIVVSACGHERGNPRIRAAVPRVVRHVSRAGPSTPEQCGHRVQANGLPDARPSPTS